MGLAFVKQAQEEGIFSKREESVEKKKNHWVIQKPSIFVKLKVAQCIKVQGQV